MLKNAVRTRQSGARFVGRTHGTPIDLLDNEHQTHLEEILPTTITLAMTKKIMTNKNFTKQKPDKVKIQLCEGIEIDSSNLDVVLQNFC